MWGRLFFLFLMLVAVILSQPGHTMGNASGTAGQRYNPEAGDSFYYDSKSGKCMSNIKNREVAPRYCKPAPTHYIEKDICYDIKTDQVADTSACANIKVQTSNCIGKYLFDYKTGNQYNIDGVLYAFPKLKIVVKVLCGQVRPDDCKGYTLTSLEEGQIYCQ